MGYGVGREEANTSASTNTKNTKDNTINTQENPKLTTQQAQAIQAYTGDAFKEIHKAIHTGTYTTTYRKIPTWIQHIDEALQTHKTHTPKHLYRGIPGNHPLFKEHNGNIEHWANNKAKPGTQLHFPSYQSATHNLKTALEFATPIHGTSLILEIQTPEGINITNYSLFKQETETLLPRNSQYLIIGRKNITENKETRIHLYLIAVNSQGEILNGTNSDHLKPIQFTTKNI